MMETKNPHADGAGASCVAANYAKPFSGIPCSFQALKEAHLYWQAELALIDASGTSYDEDQDHIDDVSERHADALNALMLAPAPDLWELRHKLKVFARHEVADCWVWGKEIADLLARDAERLIRWGVQ